MDSSVVRLAGSPERIFQAWQVLRQSQGAKCHASGTKTEKPEQRSA